MMDYKLIPIRTNNIGEYKFVADRYGKGWVLLTKQEFEAVQNLQKVQNVKELAYQFPHLGYEALLEVVEELKAQGLLIHSDDNAHCACNMGCLEGRERPRMIIVKMTDQCNLECLYCYANASVKCNSKVSVETLCRIIDQLVEMHSDKEVEILYHGGEPMLCLDVIESACAYSAEKYGKRVVFGMQTNGTLINERSMKVIKKYDIRVGISMDGHAKVHDITRCGPKGIPSHDRVMKGIEFLRKENLGLGICNVINGYNYEEIEELIDFYIEHNIKNLAFLPIMPAGRSHEHNELYLNSEQLFEAFKKAFYRIINYNATCETDDERIRERYLCTLTEKILLYSTDNRCMCTPCGAGIQVLSTDTKGNVYVCDDFANDMDYCIGNVWDSTLSEMVEHSELIEKLHQRKVTDNDFCKECSWQGICGGICLGQINYAKELGMDVPIVCEMKKKLIPFLIKQYQKHPNLLRLVGSAHVLADGSTYHLDLDEKTDAETLSQSIRLYRLNRRDCFIIFPSMIQKVQDAVELTQILSRFFSVLVVKGSFLADQDVVEDIACSAACQIRIVLQVQDLYKQDIQMGIQRLVDEKRKFEDAYGLEIELMFRKEDLDSISSAYRTILEKYPQIDMIRMGLPQDITSLENEEYKMTLNEVLNVARETDSEEYVRLGDMPICFLNQENEFFLPRQSHAWDDRPYIVLDSYYEMGRNAKPLQEDLQEKCKSCAYIGTCGFAARPILEVADTNQR